MPGNYEAFIPRSVDTSGDLSRNSKLSHTSHRSEVGTPQYAPPYKPALHHQHEQEGSSTNPLKCALVLGTRTESGTVEYRIGKFLDARGLWEPLDPFDKSTTSKLRSHVVQKCFGESIVYDNRNDAVLAADKQYPNNHGIKVMVHTFRFPQ